MCRPKRIIGIESIKTRSSFREKMVMESTRFRLILVLIGERSTQHSFCIFSGSYLGDILIIRPDLSFKNMSKPSFVRLLENYFPQGRLSDYTSYFCDTCGSASGLGGRAALGANFLYQEREPAETRGRRTNFSSYYKNDCPSPCNKIT
jgi:hypothetical protein